MNSFHQEEISRAWYTLYQISARSWPELKEKLDSIDNDDELASAFNSHVINIVQANNVEHDVLALVGLMEDFAICIKSEICDCSFGSIYLGSFMQDVWNRYAPYIYFVRQDSANSAYGENLETYIREVAKNGFECP